MQIGAIVGALVLLVVGLSFLKRRAFENDVVGSQLNDWGTHDRSWEMIRYSEKQYHQLFGGK